MLVVTLHLLASVCIQVDAVGAYDVTELTYVVHDPARSGHELTATVYVPQGQAVLAPVAAFAHGFGLGAGLYPLAKDLTARRGMVVFLPHNLGVVPSTLNLALDQAFLLQHAVQQSARNASSPFYGRVANQTFLMGHSLGGGSSILAADPLLAGAYAPTTAIATVSLGTYTIPNALKSAPNIPARMPALLMTATEDCIDPPAKNSAPVFDAMPSQCSYVVSVVGGSHCQYASGNIGCHLTETLCGAHPNITDTQQWEVALSVILPYIDAVVSDSVASWSKFDTVLGALTGRDEILVLNKRTASCGKSEPSKDIDDDFPKMCQRVIAGDLRTQLNIAELKAGEGTFLTTKPSLQSDANHSIVNVTIVSHVESVPDFASSIAIKMKSREAISFGTSSTDNATCEDLHGVSLATALASLTSDERAAYGVRTKKIVFSVDEEWHTGLYVALAKLRVNETANAVTVTAPRFHASTKIPGAWGGVTYCRLLPPSSIQDWILKQLANETSMIMI